LEVRRWDTALKLDRELDVLMLGCMFPPYCSVTSKSSLKYYPFLGWFSMYIYVKHERSELTI